MFKKPTAPPGGQKYNQKAKWMAILQTCRTEIAKRIVRLKKFETFQT